MSAFVFANNKKLKLSTIYQYLGEYDDNIFPTKLKTLINFYYLIFFRIVIANILVITFLIIKKIEINNIILKIIRPPLCKFLLKMFFRICLWFSFYILLCFLCFVNKKVSTNFDMCNTSYAWDTATLFLQTCGTNTTY